ncbi:MAG TPA: hypothetical protein VK980_02985 [Sphingomonas sp.]|nr:hypothetical protein [Sphingomonas sp.]
MRRLLSGIALVCLAPALRCPAAAAGGANWQLFQSVTSGGQQFDYYYDKAGVVVADDKITVTLRILGKPARSVTLSSIELNCRTVTYTETSTISTDAAGHKTVLAASDLWRDAPIQPGKSADKLRRLLCR